MECFKISSIPGYNIGHFFHETLFYALDAYIKNNQIKWILCKKLKEWELQFTLLCIKHLNINYEYSDLTGYRTGLPFNISKNPNLFYILELIQTIIKKEYPDATFNENYKILYFRNDAARRRMIGYDNKLNGHFDEIIYNFNDMSFEKQVRLFMKCSHFVTIEGANLTNIIFMDKRAKVLDISPTNNSWQLMFGTSYAINTFNYLILYMDDFNKDIQYNEKIENAIVSFLK
jgi:capsular polysaccharide biosynthesis protein